MDQWYPSKSIQHLSFCSVHLLFCVGHLVDWFGWSRSKNWSSWWVWDSHNVRPSVLPSVRPSVCLSICPSVPTVGTLWAYIYGERYLVGLTYLVGLLSLTRTWVSLSRKQPYKLIGLHFSPKVTDSSRNFVCDLGKVHSSRAFLMNVLYVWTMHNIVIHMWTIHDNFLHKHL